MIGTEQNVLDSHAQEGDERVPGGGKQLITAVRGAEHDDLRLPVMAGPQRHAVLSCAVTEQIRVQPEMFGRLGEHDPLHHHDIVGALTHGRVRIEDPGEKRTPGDGPV